MKRKSWKIISGGQTGVDRAALVSAMTFSIPFGGWIPKGRLTEDGFVPKGFYAMRECAGGYRERTRRNVESSDATLILANALPLEGGTAYTARVAEECQKPLLVVPLGEPEATRIKIRDWMISLENRSDMPERITLNVAGPRESKAPGIFECVRKQLERLLWDFRNGSGGDLYSIDEKGEASCWLDAEYASPPDDPLLFGKE